MPSPTRVTESDTTDGRGGDEPTILASTPAVSIRLSEVTERPFGLAVLFGASSTTVTSDQNTPGRFAKYKPTAVLISRPTSMIVPARSRIGGRRPTTGSTGGRSVVASAAALSATH